MFWLCRHLTQPRSAFSTHQLHPFLSFSSCIVHSKFTPPVYLTVCMNMKVVLNKKLSWRVFNRATINFWKPDQVEEDSTTRTSYKDDICHEVKYNPAHKKSQSFKLYIKPFSHSTAKQWLKFMDKLKIVIHSNGLDNDGPACFNVTRSSLKGNALHVCNDKATEKRDNG